MKTNKPILTMLVLLAFFFAGCTSMPVDPTPKQELVANAVEDALSIGLVPVLTKNPSYAQAATSVAAALGTFSGTTITPQDVDAFLAKTALASDDARVVAGVINAAWDTYVRRYSKLVDASVRPDVKLFLSAVSNGIVRAIAAVPR